MRKSQWFTLSFGSFALYGFFSYYRSIIFPHFTIARMLSLEGTSNLEVITSLSWFYTSNLATMFLVIGIVLAICGWLEPKNQ